jgi:MFS-type transporter involved in bile tolerance (Atg22 family)
MAEMAPYYAIIRRGGLLVVLFLIGLGTWSLGAEDWLVGVVVGGSLGPLFAIERVLFVRWANARLERES